MANDEQQTIVASPAAAARLGGRLARVLVLFTALALLGCTPNMEDVKRRSGPQLTRMLRTPVHVVHAKSEFNEGNGDPKRVRVWLESAKDPAMRLSLSARFESDALQLDEDRVRKRFAAGQQALVWTRTFNESAVPHLRRFVSLVEGGGGANARRALVLVYAEPCAASDCATWRALHGAVQAFLKRSSGALELSVRFLPPANYRPQKGRILMRHLPPKDPRHMSERGADFAIGRLPVTPQTSAAELRRALVLRRLSTRYQNAFRETRQALVVALTKQTGEAWALERGGSVLKLVSPSLTRVHHKATACPARLQRKSKKCPKGAAKQVSCEFDTATQVLTLMTAVPGA